VLIMVATRAVVVLQLLMIVRARSPLRRSSRVVFDHRQRLRAPGPHRRAQHRRRGSTPDREHDSQQNQQPQAKGLHGGDIASAGLV